jgi:hypothetical protein
MTEGRHSRQMGNYDGYRQRSENLGKLFLGRFQKIFAPLINEFNGSIQHAH